MQRIHICGQPDPDFGKATASKHSAPFGSVGARHARVLSCSRLFYVDVIEIEFVRYVWRNAAKDTTTTELVDSRSFLAATNSTNV